MRSYTYRFVWTDLKTKKLQRKYLDAPSREDAVIDFEHTFNLSVDLDKVTVSRVTG